MQADERGVVEPNITKEKNRWPLLTYFLCEIDSFLRQIFFAKVNNIFFQVEQGLLETDPLVRGMDLDPAPDPAPALDQDPPLFS